MAFTQVPSLIAPLQSQIEALRAGIPTGLVKNEILGVLLIGSASRGEATYRSDVDLLFVLKEAPLNYQRTVSLKRQIEPSLRQEPLPVQLQFVLPSVFETTERAMREALARAIILIDPTGVLASRLSGISGRGVA